MKVVVDRKTWLRGEGGENSYLKRDDGKMCCLGFACVQAGLDKDDIAGRYSPADVIERGIRLPAGVFSLVSPSGSDSQVCESLMLTNDDKHYLDEEREAKLITLGKEVGLEFEFIN